MSDVIALAGAATTAASQGRWNEAEQLWRQVLALDSRHPQALFSLGVHAFRRGQLAEALQLLQAAHVAAPDDPAVLLSVARVLREQGAGDAEKKAIDASLAADPYFLPGLLAKAEYLERHDRPRLAAPVYRNALKVAPPEPQWPPALRAQLAHARALVDQVGSEMADFLAAYTGDRMAALAPVEAQRWREAGAIASGRSAPYHAVCSQLHVPRLPAIPFFERDAFPWAAALESATGAIMEELAAVIAAEQDQLQPYIAYRPGDPVNQWRELNHSPRWNSYFLWQNGSPVEAHLVSCPRTAQALQEVDMPDIDGNCPNAMFSLLAARTHIPPHHGETNARTVVHLPLVVPGHCVFRVGFEQRQWKPGEILAFDDSIEHEARNDSDELRVVLIFDTWNPLLSPAERDMVRALSAAAREFQRQ